MRPLTADTTSRPAGSPRCGAPSPCRSRRAGPGRWRAGRRRGRRRPPRRSGRGRPGRARSRRWPAGQPEHAAGHGAVHVAHRAEHDSSAVSAARASAPSRPARGAIGGRARSRRVHSACGRYVNDPCHTEVARVVGESCGEAVRRRSSRRSVGLGLGVLGARSASASAGWVGDRAVGLEVLQLDVVAGLVGDGGGLDDAWRAPCRARPRTTISGMWLCSSMCWMNSCGFWPDCCARRIRCSCSSPSLTPISSVLATWSSTNWAATASRTRFSRSASNSSTVCSSESRYGLHGHAGHRELLLDLLLAGRQLGLHDGLRQGDLDQVEQLLQDGVAGGGGLLEALAAGQPGAHVVVSSATVSNSEAVWAKSSSSSGSSCSLTEVTLTSTSTSSPSSRHRRAWRRRSSRRRRTCRSAPRRGRRACRPCRPGSSCRWPRRPRRPRRPCWRRGR